MQFIICDEHIQFAGIGIILIYGKLIPLWILQHRRFVRESKIRAVYSPLGKICIEYTIPYHMKSFQIFIKVIVQYSSFPGCQMQAKKPYPFCNDTLTLHYLIEQKVICKIQGML